MQLLLQEWLEKHSCTQKELKRLLGHLSCADTIVRPGRIFLCYLFNMLPQAPRPYHHTRLNRQAQADLRWWQHFIWLRNGMIFFPDKKTSVHVYSDASGSFWCGVFSLHSGWFQLQWPASWNAIEIAAKELVPVVAAAATWGQTWGACRVMFHVDNMAVVSVLQRQAPNDLLLTHLSHCLYFYAAIYHFEFSATHIAGSQNTAADALPCDNLSLFSMLFLQVPHSPIPLPVVDLLLSLSSISLYLSTLWFFRSL